MCIGRPIVSNPEFFIRLMTRAYELRDLEEMNIFDAIERAFEELRA
jgi:hypothetical protein